MFRDPADDDPGGTQCGCETVRRALVHLSRFGRSLIQVPGSAELLGDLGREVRRGLDLTWARVSLDAADGPPLVVTDGTPGGATAATVPIEVGMQRDLATTLRHVREIAYAIHPPVLADRGLLEAIEAQSSRLALPMAVRADPRLRGARFGERIEATAWYVVAEALANVVKHAEASEVQVSLSQEDGRLGLVIRDDGRGFDVARPRGLGLISLSDRLDTVGGSLTINSGAGLGTSVSVHIPVGLRG